MSRLGNVRQMFASALAALSHKENSVLAALFPVCVHLIESVPLTFGEYLLVYVGGLVAFYSWDFRRGLWWWGLDQYFRRRPPAP